MVTRRTLLVAAGAAVVGAVPLAGPAAAALPQLDMEALIKAAQIDPRRADTALTEGAKDSVLLVERALQARGLLSSTYVDGHFGTSTIAAYAAYQRSLGYTGLDATGLPGPSSLRSLGEGRYTVVGRSRPAAW
ncbi:peptidoglycan-binding domain-containing protein [Micromonospora sp. M12]